MSTRDIISLRFFSLGFQTMNFCLKLITHPKLGWIFVLFRQWCKNPAYIEYISYIISDPDDTSDVQNTSCSINLLHSENSGTISLKNGTTYSDNKCKAEILNEYFSGAFTEEQDNPKTDLLGTSTCSSIPSVSVHEADVWTQDTESLRTWSGSSQFFKEVSVEVALAMTKSSRPHYTRVEFHLTGAIPLSWLCMKGVPTNYQPVSLISLACKCLQHIVCHYTMTQLDGCSILREA